MPWDWNPSRPSARAAGPVGGWGVKEGGSDGLRATAGGSRSSLLARTWGGGGREWVDTYRRVWRRPDQGLGF